MDDSPTYSGTEIGMTGNAVAINSFVAGSVGTPPNYPPARLVIERIGMTGNARSEGGSVIAASGGADHIPTGMDLKIREVAREFQAQSTNTNVQASKNRALFVEGEKSSVSQEKETEPDIGTCDFPSTFGHSDTAAILIAGAGKHSDIFIKNISRMKALLTDYVGIDATKIYEVIPRKQPTKPAIWNAISSATEDLKDAPTGHFILFYSGHFSENRKFVINCKESFEKETITDETLAKELKKIQAKYMLLVMEMCYSRRAEVGAMDDDDDDDDDEDAENIGQGMPRLWEFFNTSDQAMSHEETASAQSPCIAEKVVHWASSETNEKSFVSPTTNTSYFMNAIKEVIEAGRGRLTELPLGQTHATVLQLNTHVKEHVQNARKHKKTKQTPTINPPEANENYFKTFPAFAKLL